MNQRTIQSQQILETCKISQLDKYTFKVQSQTDTLLVSRTGNGLICECVDHQNGKSDCKHIKAVLSKLKQNKGYANAEFRIMERTKLQLCKFCDSGNIVKAGMRKNKSGDLQMFKCKECKKRFSMNFGFENRQFDQNTITGALQMYYSGMSVRDIENHYAMMGVKVDHSTIYTWIDRYSKMTATYINGIVPRTPHHTMVRADEVWVKIAGDQKYLFASMDDDSRYWIALDMAQTKFQHNADALLDMTKKQIGKSPTHFVTDGLPAYKKSSIKVFGKTTNHISNAGINSRRTCRKIHPTNNKMERLNGEIRDREKVFRGLKKMDTPIIDGMRVYYNYAKRHSALGGKTPAEAARIKVDGDNKWRTLIQNASLNRNTV